MEGRADRRFERELVIAGRFFWLKPGANSFGSDPSNQIVFPKGPAHAGEFELNGKEVSLKLQPEARATIDAKPVTTAKLDPDTAKHVTHVEMGTLRFHVIVRGERVGIRVRDTDSVAARNFKGMVFFPLDMNYRVTATWVPADGNKMVEIPNVLGDVTAQPVPGVVTFKVYGEELRLTALGGDAKTGCSSCSTTLRRRAIRIREAVFLTPGRSSMGTSSSISTAPTILRAP